MSATPPDPGIPSTFPSDMASYSYDSATHGLRTPTGVPAYVVLAEDSAGGHGAVTWAIDGARTPCPVAALTAATYALICAGSVAGGYLVSGGVTYHLRAVRHPADGSQWIEATTS